MDAPPVKYVRTSDGYDIACITAGEGRPFVFMHSTFGNVHVAWKRYRRWMEGLADRYQLISFDPRGWGLSTRGLPPDLTLADYDNDLPAVIDGLQLQRVVLYAFREFSHFAVRYAYAHPERVEALIVSGTRVAMPGDITFQLAQTNWEFFLRALAPRGIPTDEYDEWMNDTRESVTVDDFTKVYSPLLLESSVEHEVRHLEVPLLVMHPRSFPNSPQEESRKVAALAPDSRFVPLGDDLHNLYGSLHGDPDQGLAAIDDFLKGLPNRTPSVVAGDGNLSPRELEVLRLLATGKSNEEIADELVISRNTVRRHVSNLFDKTGVSNRTQAASYARDHGLI